MSQAHFWSLAVNSCSAAQLSSMADSSYLGHEKTEFQLFVRFRCLKLYFFCLSLLGDCPNQKADMLIWVEHMPFFEATPTLTKGRTRVVSRAGCCSSLWGPALPASVQLLLLHGVWIKQFLVTVNRRLAQYMLLLCLMRLSLILEKINNPAYLKERVKLSTYHIKIFQGAICFVFYCLPISGPHVRGEKNNFHHLEKKSPCEGTGKF